MHLKWERSCNPSCTLTPGPFRGIRWCFRSGMLRSVPFRSVPGNTELYFALVTIFIALNNADGLPTGMGSVDRKLKSNLEWPIKCDSHFAVGHKIHLSRFPAHTAASLPESSLIPRPSHPSVCRLQYYDKRWGEKAWERGCPESFHGGSVLIGIGTMPRSDLLEVPQHEYSFTYSMRTNSTNSSSKRTL